MPTFRELCLRANMRHDFSDQIQVRYRHTNGEDYDAWVSGEEALQRLRSTVREQQLKGLSRLDWQMIRRARETLPEEGKLGLIKVYIVLGRRLHAQPYRGQYRFHPRIHF